MTLERLPRCWYFHGLPGYRECPGTYCRFPYTPLTPPRDLGWLLDLPPVDSSLAEPFDPPPTRAARAEALEGLPVPESFRAFLGDPEPRRRLRSYTDCYLDLADAPVAFGSGQLLHFLSDQQWCLHWLLYFDAAGGEAVVVTPEPLGFAGEDCSGTDLAVCAESFLEFVYRFWLENEICFAGVTTPEQRRYLGL